MTNKWGEQNFFWDQGYLLYCKKICNKNYYYYTV